MKSYLKKEIVSDLHIGDDEIKDMLEYIEFLDNGCNLVILGDVVDNAAYNRDKDATIINSSAVYYKIDAKATVCNEVNGNHEQNCYEHKNTLKEYKPQDLNPDKWARCPAGGAIVNVSNYSKMGKIVELYIDSAYTYKCRTRESNLDIPEDEIISSGLPADIDCMHDILIIYTHYPQEYLSDDSQQRLINIGRRFGCVLYVCGHTHINMILKPGEYNNAFNELRVGCFNGRNPDAHGYGIASMAELQILEKEEQVYIVCKQYEIRNSDEGKERELTNSRNILAADS